jgi:hypothetical protein
MKRFIILSLTLVLSSCAVHGTKFECAPGKGAGCKSVSKVNKMVDHNEFEDLFDEDFNTNSISKPYNSTNWQNPDRLVPQGKRIWIAPKKNTKGTYNSETYIEVN